MASSEVQLSDVEQGLLAVMRPDEKLEQYLGPAPLGAMIIGQLMRISTKQDFSLEAGKPEEGWGPIRNPKSFSTCLLQVSNDSYIAFCVAHKNMDLIRLKTSKVPGILKTALVILFEGENDEIMDCLPVELDRIKNASDECLRLAREVENKFQEIINLTIILQEACSNTRRDQEVKLKQAEKQKKLKEEEKKKLEKLERLQKNREDDLKQSLKRAEDGYYETKRKVDRADWSTIFLETLRTIFAQHSSEDTKAELGRLNTAKDVLQDTNERHQKAVTEQQKTMDEIMKITVEMSKLNLEEISFEETVEVLRKGVGLFSQLKEHWSQMSLFFDMTSNLMKEALTEPLAAFDKHSRKQIKNMEDREAYSPTVLAKKIIEERAHQGAMCCLVAEQISGAYVDISGEHLMKGIAGVGKILGYNPKTQKRELEKAQKELTKGCQEAQRAIKMKMGQEKEKLINNASKRLRELYPEMQGRIE